MPFELISFKTGGEWIGKLWSKFKSIKSKYEQEINEINNIMFVDPEELAKYYVEPNCQETNPADHHEERFLTATEPVMRKIDQFFGAKVFQPGDNQLFVLSDAGMGKSALLTMLKLMHLTAFWPQGKDCVLKKLGKKTLDEISEIKEKKETILLLDSLDEDPTAYGRVRERLSDILQATQAFFRVIITCRTQFFTSDADPFNKPGVAVVFGFRCPVKYLSFFDDNLVEKYLLKRFRKIFELFPDNKKIEEAKKVIAKMGSLRCRPMLLSYIEDLMASPVLAKEDSEYQVYNALIESWLNREKSKYPDISKENLSDASIILATILQIKGLRGISEEKLDKLISKIARLRPVKEIDLKGRSLLNRNSEGDYRFSHYSIQEFLVTKLLLSDKPIFTPRDSIDLTDFIFRMILASKDIPKFLNLMNFNRLNFNNFDFKGANITIATVAGIKLDMAKMAGAYIVNTVGMKLVCVPAGEFMMGSLDNESGRYDNEILHKVILTKGFYIQTAQITQKQWQIIMGNNPSRFKEGGEDCPVESVSYDDVQEFIKKLNLKEGIDKYRLPTEAEWEYACRAETNTAYFFGNDESKLKEYAWYDKNSDSRTHPVGLLKPNAWGLYDMHGNVWEWCQDWHGEYTNSLLTDPMGPNNGSARILRGGGLNNPSQDCRSANRGRSTQGNRGISFGFRIVRDI
jgi:formylglycine-generating enzyme required for sulfatase activity